LALILIVPWIRPGKGNIHIETTEKLILSNNPISCKRPSIFDYHLQRNLALAKHHLVPPSCLVPSSEDGTYPRSMAGKPPDGKICPEKQEINVDVHHQYMKHW